MFFARNREFRNKTIALEKLNHISFFSHCTSDILYIVLSSAQISVSNIVFKVLCLYDISVQALRSLLSRNDNPASYVM